MQACPKVLIVEGDEELRSIMRTVIEKAGMESVEASEGLSAVNIAASHSPDVMFLGCHLPDMTASEVFSRARELNTSLPVIVIAGCGEESAMGMLEAGACDCLLKPFTTDQLLQSIQQALSDNRHERPKPRAIHGAKKHHLPLEEQMGHSAKIKALAGEVGRVAPTDFSVLISGETGSGKEIVAQAIYAQSNRRARPFIAIDCGAIAETLIESELFGHEKGAFTGADRTKPGKFEIAAGGTVFLDEISSLPLSLQAKLLRFLQERHFYRVGGTSSIKADARILAATNHDLANAPATVFRRDLYHRLGEYTICVTPLRDRKEDIIHLARRFLKQTNAELGKKVCDFSQEALDLLLAYNWPGNVRELRNVVRRGVLLAEDTIAAEHLDTIRDCGIAVATAPPCELGDVGAVSLKEIVRRGVAAIESSVLTRVLEQAGGNKAEAARILRIDYKTIHTKLKGYGITAKEANHGEHQNHQGK